MLKFIIGVALLWVTFKLAYYLRAITPTYNRPEAFRNEIAFALLNLVVICTFIGGIWLVIAGLF